MVSQCIKPEKESRAVHKAVLVTQGYVKNEMDNVVRFEETDHSQILNIIDGHQLYSMTHERAS